jgi:sulfur transfer protein SufE
MTNKMTYTEIKSLLMQIDDPVLRLEFVMDLGRNLSPIPQPCACTEVSGCVSRVQICKSENVFFGDADSQLVRGIVAIIIAMANEGISDLRSEFNSLNLNLGAGRLNGVEAIIKVIS